MNVQRIRFFKVGIVCALILSGGIWVAPALSAGDWLDLGTLGGSFSQAVWRIENVWMII